jgi:hypothetical protein
LPAGKAGDRSARAELPDQFQRTGFEGAFGDIALRHHAFEIIQETDPVQVRRDRTVEEDQIRVCSALRDDFRDVLAATHFRLRPAQRPAP